MISKAAAKKYTQILCVDDNRNNLFTMETLLSGIKNCRILTAISGQKALEILLSEEIDLILLDIQMPEMDGFEVANLVKSNKRTKDIPIVFITAVFKAEKFLQKGYEVGAVDYITKPVDDNQLANKINHYLKLIEKENELIEINSLLKQNIKEKELLLREVHHRVKNNMQVIISMLRLQSRHVQDEKCEEILKESRNRISSMALIHEKLYQMNDISNINFSDYAQKLAKDIFHSFGANSNKISLNIDIKGIALEIGAAIPCGLIINELISNSLKYAFPGDRKGELRIEMRKVECGALKEKNGEGKMEDRGQGAEDWEKNKTLGTRNPQPATFNPQLETIELVVSDNGVGFPKELDLLHVNSLGLQLVQTLVKQLHGKMELKNKNGTKFMVRFNAA